MTPITIQQTAEDAKLAFELHTHAELDSIRLQKARATSQPLLEPMRTPIVLRINRKAKQAQAPEGIVRFEVEFRLAGERETEGSEGESSTAKAQVVLVECTWELDYRLQKDYQPSPAALKAFKDGNAIFNCWPYFREYLQNTVTRMNLPPLTVPLLRLLPKPPRKKPTQAQAVPSENTSDEQ